MRGAGLAADVEAQYLGARRGAAWLGDRHQHVAHLACGIWLDDWLARHGLIEPEKAHRHQHAIIGKNGVGAGQLHQTERNPVAIAHGGLFNRFPGFVRTHATGGFAREAGLRHAAKADIVK